MANKVSCLKKDFWGTPFVIDRYWIHFQATATIKYWKLFMDHSCTFTADDTSTLNINVLFYTFIMYNIVRRLRILHQHYKYSSLLGIGKHVRGAPWDMKRSFISFYFFWMWKKTVKKEGIFCFLAKKEASGAGLSLFQCALHARFS